ncbi:MAG TPA: hypothetical protein VGL34_00050 [Steroidobacteraceae bacterium]
MDLGAPWHRRRPEQDLGLNLRLDFDDHLLDDRDQAPLPRGRAEEPELEMSHSFARRHAKQLTRYETGEQKTEEIHCAPRLGEILNQSLQASMMPADQLIDSRMQTFERAVMRGQYKHIVRDTVLEGIERHEPVVNGSASGSVGCTETFDVIRGNT